MATSSLPWMGNTARRALERKALKSPAPPDCLSSRECSLRPDSNVLGLLPGLPPPRDNRIVLVAVTVAAAVVRCLRWPPFCVFDGMRVVVDVVGDVRVAWHMGENDEKTSSTSAIVNVVRMGEEVPMVLISSLGLN